MPGKVPYWMDPVPQHDPKTNKLFFPDVSGIVLIEIPDGRTMEFRLEGARVEVQPPTPPEPPVYYQHADNVYSAHTWMKKPEFTVTLSIPADDAEGVGNMTITIPQDKDND